MQFSMDAYNKLITHKVKPSAQRIAIMNYLLTHRTHPSVEEIYTNLCGDMPTLSKTTVYNTLKLLSKNGAALMLTIDENKVCFDGDITPHTHFFCTRCGRIFDLSQTISAKEMMEVNAEGHVITEIHCYYRGICKNCLTDKK